MNDTKDNTPIGIGTLVVLELESQSGDTEKLALTLVADERADFRAGFLGADTPLGKTIMGRRTGQVLPYRMGDIVRVRILSVEAKGKEQSEDVTARREAVIRKAVRHSDYVNMITFASSVNSKWGDYDIDKIDPSQWEDENNDTDKEI